MNITDDVFDDVFDDSDSDDGYEEFADYIFKYSDKEIRAIVQDYLSNGGNKTEALVKIFLKYIIIVSKF